ncbi:MAG: FecR family protein, partial [Gammaproteobacteria bacterium]|nr:FecR family protein [Gammaproteobacteria bacterium]
NLTIWIKTPLFIITLIFSGGAISENSIGHVIHTSGNLIATNNGSKRFLERGSDITEGDVVNSGNRAKAQLRMKDGALIVLRQNSEMHFEEYKYDEEDKSIGSSIFSLLKGGFKTISGLIGKRNKRNYQVKTAFTTIGIRGTDYGVTLCEQGNCSDGENGTLKDGLYASVIDGEISSTNEAGLFIFSNDEYFYVASNTSEPLAMLKAPGVIFDPNTVDTDNKNMDANNEYSSLLADNNLDLSAATHTNIDRQNTATYNDTLAASFDAASDISNNAHMIYSSPGDTMMFSYFQGTPAALSPVTQTLVDDGTGDNQFALNAIAADNGTLIPLASHITFGAPVTTRTLYIANATANNTGSMNLGGTNLSWGRWSGDLYETTDAGTVIANTGSLHYAVVDGGLTTPAQLSAMTGTFNYTTVAGTNATDNNGNVAGNVADVNMAVDFGLQNINSFSVATNVAGIDYQAELINPTAITTATSTGMSITGNTLGLCPTCGGLASLGFVGTQAEGAVTNYSIGNASATSTITGTAILTR